MLQIFFRRLLSLIPLLLIVSLLVTGLLYLIPGDPAVTLSGDNPTPERIAQIRENLGLDRSFAHRYLDWLGGLLHGDLGTSLFSGRSVNETLLHRMPPTLSITALALMFALVVGLTCGIVGAVWRGSWADKLTAVFSSIAISVPNYWLGLMLLIVFALNIPIFPALGYVPISQGVWPWFTHILLPALALGAVAGGEFARQVRSSLSQTLDEQFIRAARAKGLRTHQVIGKHALKTSLGPALTMLGLQTSSLIGGSVIVESIFVIPGIGELAIRSVIQNDIPMIQGIVVYTVVVVVLVNLAVDMIHAWLDPKVRQA